MKTCSIENMLYRKYAQNGFFHKGLLNSVTNLHKLYVWSELPLFKIIYSAHMGSVREQESHAEP